jgi:hypothetical protein
VAYTERYRPSRNEAGAAAGDELSSLRIGGCAMAELLVAASVLPSRARATPEAKDFVQRENKVHIAKIVSTRFMTMRRGDISQYRVQVGNFREFRREKKHPNECGQAQRSPPPASDGLEGA